MSLQSLPDPAYATLVEHLDLASLANLTRTCRALRSIDTYSTSFKFVCPLRRTDRSLEAYYLLSLVKRGAKVKSITVRGCSDERLGHDYDLQPVILPCRDTLESLELRWVKHTASALLGTLEQLHRLKRLTLHIFLAEIPVEEVLHTLCLPCLKYLHLEGPKTACWPVGGLVSFIQRHAHLTSLLLGRIRCESLASTPLLLPSLKRLQLSWCDNVDPRLLHSCTCLTSLHVENCSMSQELRMTHGLNSRQLYSWQDSLSRLQHLKQASLDFGFCLLPALLPSWRGMEALSLNFGSEICPGAVGLTGRAEDELTGPLSSKSLKCLLLTGARNRGRVLLKCPALRYLVIDNAGLGKDEVISVLEELADLAAPVEGLYVSCGEVLSGQSAPALGGALARLSTLKTLATTNCELRYMLQHVYSSVEDLYLSFEHAYGTDLARARVFNKRKEDRLKSVFPALQHIHIVGSFDQEAQDPAECKTSESRAKSAGVSWEPLSMADLRYRWFRGCQFWRSSVSCCECEA